MSDLELTADQVEELAIMSTSILINLSLNYYSDPVDLRNIVVRSFDGALSMSVEQSSVH
jgi:hypothetical protein